MLRLRGGAPKTPFEECLRRFVQQQKRLCDELTSTDLVGMVEDEYGVIRSEQWVRKWWKRLWAVRKLGSGGQNRITDVNRRKIVKLCAGFVKDSSGGLKRKLSSRECSRELKRRKISITQRSIVTVLKEAGLQYKVRSNASRLSVKNVGDRKIYYERFKNYSNRDWMRVLFTDSTKFELQHAPNSRNEGSYVRAGEIVPAATINKHPPYVHVYGGICGHFVVGPYFIEASTSINGQLYSSEIIPKFLKDIKKLLNALGVGYEIEFQQDGATPHFCKLTLDKLDVSGINYWKKGVHPGNSPDLSYIENFWGSMKQNIYRNGEPKSIKQLQTRVRKYFKNFLPAACKKYALSMPRRLEALRAAEYGRIPY